MLVDDKRIDVPLGEGESRLQSPAVECYFIRRGRSVNELQAVSGRTAMEESTKSRRTCPVLWSRVGTRLWHMDRTCRNNFSALSVSSCV